MPEEDLETAELKEQIDQRLEDHEHHEHHGHAKPEQPPGWLRYLSLSTAMIAVFAAVASLESGSNSNEAILEKSEAMLSQSRASDAWSYFQAKGIKATVAEDIHDMWTSVDARGLKATSPDDGAANSAGAGEAKPGDIAESKRTTNRVNIREYRTSRCHPQRPRGRTAAIRKSHHSRSCQAVSDGRRHAFSR